MSHYPILKCLHCGHTIWLPRPESPETESGQSLCSPGNILARKIACPECGFVAPYAGRDVQWELSSPLNEDRVCWSIETGCDEERCEFPIAFHILADAKRSAEEIRLLMARRFTEEFFQGLICGRGHVPGKNRIRAVERVG